MNDSGKADLYRNYKTLLDTERYLFLDMPYILRKTFARFRCSNHDLMIEKGRYMNIERELRYCPICLSNGLYVVETEYHFLLECNEYEEIRQTLFDDIWLMRKTMTTFNKIMSSSEERIIYKVANFLHKALEKRSRLIK